MSKLPDFVIKAASSLQAIKSYRYFDYFLVSGRYFDASLLFRGFSLLYPKRDLSVEVSTSKKSEELHLQTGELLIVPKSYELNFCMKGADYLKISVSGHFLSFKNVSDAQEEVFRCECHPISDNKQSLLNLFTEFQESCKKESVISKFRSEALLKLLIADILDMADGHRMANYEKGKRRESYNKLSMYLRENALFVQDSKQISEILGYTVQYLNSLTHEFRKMSLKETVNFYRLEISRESLLNTDTNIADIAADCGFKSSAYFIKVFRQVYGITPLQCRKKLRQKENKSLKALHRVLSFELIKPSKKVPEIIYDSEHHVTISVVNTTESEIILSWLDQENHEIEMHRINAAHRIHLGTCFKECWSVRDKQGNLIAYYSVPETNCQIIV